MFFLSFFTSDVECQFSDFYQAAIAIKINNLFICFCRFDSSRPILEQDIFIEYLYIVLSCLVLFNSVLF